MKNWNQITSSQIFYCSLLLLPSLPSNSLQSAPDPSSLLSIFFSKLPIILSAVPISEQAHHRWLRIVRLLHSGIRAVPIPGIVRTEPQKIEVASNQISRQQQATDLKATMEPYQSQPIQAAWYRGNKQLVIEATSNIISRQQATKYRGNNKQQILRQPWNHTNLSQFKQFGDRSAVSSWELSALEVLFPPNYLDSHFSHSSCLEGT